MSKGAVIIITTGEPGVGKTYVRCARFLVDRFLIETASQKSHKTGKVTKAGIHISNFPVDIKAISETVSKKLKCTPEEVSERIQIIPEEVLKSWSDEKSSPAEYFADTDLDGCHIAIDEVHEFVNKKSSKDYLKQWADWLAQIRHRGCTIEFLTQSLNQVPDVIKDRAGVRLELVNMSTLRDPYFSILFADWYELRAMMQGKYSHSVLECEFRKGVFGFQRHSNHKRKFLLDEKYFKYYNSFSRGIKDGGKEKQTEIKSLYEFEKRKSFNLIKWFISRNILKILSRFLILFLVAYLCFFGGIPFLINLFVKSINVKNQKKPVAEKVINEKEKNISSSVAVSSSPSPSPVPVIDPKDDEISKLKTELTTYKDKYDNFKIVLLTPDYAIFSNNIKIEKGYEFKAGTYKGFKVEKIDYENRQIILSDESVITM